MALQTPEGIATDYWGNRYVSLALTGEISRIDAAGNVDTLASLPIPTPLEPCHGFIAIMGAITYTPWGLYTNLNTCDLDDRGVWWISTHSGQSARVAALPADAVANGIAHRFGNLYISDSAVGRVWRTSAFGGDPEIWFEDPWLDPVPNDVGAPGSNGIQIYGNEVYVANSSSREIIAIPFEGWGDEAGEPRLHAEVEAGCDDFAFDLFGNLYCTTNPFNTVILVYPDGESEVILDLDDGLDGPTAATFGRLHDRFSLYIANGAFPFFPNNGTPGLLRYDMPVPGYPFR